MPRLRDLLKDQVSTYVNSRSQSRGSRHSDYDNSRDSRYRNDGNEFQEQPGLGQSAHYAATPGHSHLGYYHNDNDDYRDSTYAGDAPYQQRSSNDSLRYENNTRRTEQFDNATLQSGARRFEGTTPQYTTASSHVGLASQVPYRQVIRSGPDDDFRRESDPSRRNSPGNYQGGNPPPYEPQARRESHDYANTYTAPDGRNVDPYDDDVPDEVIDQQISQHLAWTRPPSATRVGSMPKLMVPIAIPQDAPGLQQSFSRAWSPTLSDYDIRPAEFLAFLDHLNVCKAATAPLQVMNLAGSILGWTPIPYATLVGMGTQAVAKGGSIVVSKVRISRYLTRANAEYFIPRGLHVRVAKDPLLQQILHQPQGEPLLVAMDPRIAPNATTLRDRRLQALHGRIAPLQFEGLPQTTQEHNIVDKISVSMTAFQSNRKANKAAAHSNDAQQKLDEEMQKLEDEARKVEAEERNPRKRERELEKIQRDMDKAQNHYARRSGGSVGGGGSADERGASKFLWVVVESVDNVLPDPTLGEQGKNAAAAFLQSRLDRRN